MKIFKKINEIRRESEKLRAAGETIGFVPTMGALHEGHLSLVRRSAGMCGKTVVSIFVNPIQFGPNEDLSKYPKPLQIDKNLLLKEKADILFIPSSEEMYRNRETGVTSGKHSSILCGMSRKNHFDGVLTVVSKLFNIISPDFAFFGEKDYQQLTLIKKMVFDLDFKVKIVSCPIVRERDGLALSSRNSYLSLSERTEAPIIYNTLSIAADLFRKGVSPEEIEKLSKKTIEENSKGRVDYIKIYDNNLNQCTIESKKCRVFAAVFFGKTRLIDNMEVSK
ncbi:MAG: pantoate--beta-alanine ligase [bacterium]